MERNEENERKGPELRQEKIEKIFENVFFFSVRRFPAENI